MRDGVRAELEAAEGEDVGLRRILDTLVDEVELTRGDGDEWLKLSKTVEERQA